jgi:hypothetical protein
MFMMISFLGLTLACPFWPLYCVKPARLPKLIGAGRIIFHAPEYLRHNRGFVAGAEDCENL